MEEKTAVVFPGMSQSGFADVGKFMVLDPFARRRLAIADEVLGYRLLDALYAAGDDPYSESAQVAFLVNSLALADRATEEMGMVPDFCAGPSFGQKAAAVFSGALDYPEVIRLTAELAACERDYFAAEHTDVVTLTVVRVDEGKFQEYLDGLTARGRWYDISGHLDEGMFMVSVRENLLDEVKAAVSGMGGYSMSVMRPPVHAGAFAGLRKLAEREVFGRYRIGEPRLPVISDSDGAVVRSAAGMRRMLLDTFDRPIQWPDMVATLLKSDVRTMYVTGPENLFRRVKCTVRNFSVVAVDPKSALRTILRPAA
ncbi:ACP S-malonyltransferase [Amycolatopsis sp. NPDC051071]|uniref:ACP S-malonyltransferase n=1 Tax=Amycolatopsis sp. NPDC051071 TaxID=3154637 RepID=UPI00341FED77